MSTNIFCRANYQDVVGMRFIDCLDSVTEIERIFSTIPSKSCSARLPVIVTDDCGCGELIKEAGCGYLVHYGDVAGLGETLRSALEHPDVNRRMVEAGRRYIEEHLAWESVVKQVEEMYEGCVRHV
ncbi:MAG: glycosyltransferase family 4 protein [Methanoculleus sp.]|nr:glycosyltransferase family 4 protein [Methanoculleus sp.]